MLWAYGWATLDPLRKILYNFFITMSSVAVAVLLGRVFASFPFHFSRVPDLLTILFFLFVTGGLEALQVLQQADNLDGPFWEGIRGC